tara:strand:+ start:7970 stop:8227 length:258 start_codon:yes stop_codon:yes gene_type:complete
MNQIKFFGNICNHTDKNNFSADLANLSINQMLEILNTEYNVEQSILDKNNILIAINNVEISVLNNHDTIINSGDEISIISISHGG